MKGKKESVMDQFNLPSYLKNKTFAEASKAINKKFEGQNDPDSQATLKELQGRLRQAQEFVKAKAAQQSEPSTSTVPTEGTPNQFLFGGSAQKANAVPSQPDLESTFKVTNPEFDQNPNEALARQGKLIEGSQDPVINAPLRGEKEASAGQTVDQVSQLGQSAGQMGGKAGAIIGGVSQLAGTAFGNTGIDTSGDTHEQQRNKTSTGAETGKAALSGAAIGTSILPGWGTLIGGVIGAGAGLIGSGRKKRDERERADNWVNKQYAAQNNTYAMGGDVNKYNDGGDVNKYANGSNLDEEFRVTNPMFNQDAILANYKTLNARPVASQGPGMKLSLQDQMRLNIADSNATTTTPGVVSSDSNSGKAKFNPGALLRYAPVAANAYQLSKLDGPEKESYQRLGNKYEKSYVDERSIQNTVQRDVASMRDRLQGASGGSASALRANLLASQLQGTKALSNAYIQAEGINRAEDTKAQDFDLNVAKTNLQQSNIETQANAQNRGAYETQKSKLISQLGNDLGGIGQEALFKEYPELMGMDYNTRGEYIAKIKAEKARKKAARQLANYKK